MIYPNPKTLFEQNMQNLLKSEESNSSIFEAVFKLQQFLIAERTLAKSGEKNDESWQAQILAVNTLGIEGFVKSFSPFWGKTVVFPTEEEFKDSLITVLCYYYKNVENKEWGDVKDIMNMPDLNTIKYGIKVRQLEQFINQQLLQPLKRCVNG